MRHLQKLIIHLILLLATIIATPNALAIEETRSYDELREEMQQAHPYPFPKAREASNSGNSFAKKISKAIINFWDWMQETAIYLIVGIIVVSILTFCILQTIKKRKGNETEAESEGETLEYLKETDAKQMAKLLENGNYQEAIKVIYIQAIQLLGKKNLIVLQSNKTPIEFYYEVREASVKSGLMRLTSVLLAVRYGNTTATASEYEKASAAFNDIKEKLK